mgnify:CR=1 FL=1
MGKLDPFNSLVSFASSFGLTKFFCPEAKLNIFLNGHVRKKCVVLKDGIYFSVKGCKIGHVLTIEEDLPARGRLEACNHSKNSGFSRA